MDNGWIKLHRQILGNGLSNRPEYAWLWITLLLLANHKDKEFIWNGKKQTCKAGQILTGRKKLSKQSGVNESKIERILKYLEIEQQIRQQKTTKFRVITIVNWQKYQVHEQQNEQQMNNKRTTDEHKQECKKDKNDKKTTLEILKWFSKTKSIGNPEAYLQSLLNEYGEERVLVIWEKDNGKVWMTSPAKFVDALK